MFGITFDAEEAVVEDAFVLRGVALDDDHFAVLLACPLGDRLSEHAVATDDDVPVNRCSFSLVSHAFEFLLYLPAERRRQRCFARPE